ncbi:hypothetical protein PIB30_048876 [Stylosanthes scabra]|uniref:Uncharacterized protein n=1 Tax=Stylosanthes scabra TaxID=79078 RepID=A0ABU6QGQ0_9FABA|nr:hypothetical protein [Stylosanthes scabra]
MNDAHASPASALASRSHHCSPLLPVPPSKSRLPRLLPYARGVTGILLRRRATFANGPFFLSQFIKIISPLHWKIDCLQLYILYFLSSQAAQFICIPNLNYLYDARNPCGISESPPASALDRIKIRRGQAWKDGEVADPCLGENGSHLGHVITWSKRDHGKEGKKERRVERELSGGGGDHYSPPTSGGHNFHIGAPIDPPFAATQSLSPPLRFYPRFEVVKDAKEGLDEL